MNELAELRSTLKEMGIRYYKLSYTEDTHWGNEYEVTIYNDNSLHRSMIFNESGSAALIKSELLVFQIRKQNETLTPQF